MATKIDEKKMMEESALLYEERLKSPIRRYTDKSFLPVIWWNIKGNESTVNEGYGDVAAILGPRSPIRFLMIDGLPLYGMETMTLQIQSGENGLDTTYESEAVIMEGTIRPYENDFFMIPVLKEPLIFRVTGVEFDKIASESTYKIQYCLEYNDSEKREELMRQTVKEFYCILENIGTSERCIIAKSDKGCLDKIEAMYDAMAETYKTFYYNERYNCFLGDFIEGKLLYDPLQEVFITTHRLFNRRNQIDGLVLLEQFKDPKRELKYQKSIYRMIEMRRMSYLKEFFYTTYPGISNPQTAFHQWLDKNVLMLDSPKFVLADKEHTYRILSDEFIEGVRSEEPLPTPHAELIRRWVRGDRLSIHDIRLELHEEILDLDDANLEIFFFTPILMYIIQQIIKDYLSKEKRIDEVEYFDIENG